MWPRQIATRALVSTVAAAALTYLVTVRGDPDRVLLTIYGDLFAATVAIASVLVAGMAILVALTHLRSRPGIGPAFRQTIRSFVWTISYSAALAMAFLTGRLIELTPTGWTTPAVFLPLLGFTFLLTLLTGLVTAIADAMEV